PGSSRTFPPSSPLPSPHGVSLPQPLPLPLSPLSLSTFALSSFSPVDNHLLDCGSATPSTLHDGRLFVPDSPTAPPSKTNPNPNPNSPQIFRRPSMYSFPIQDPGTHTVRLHFQPFNSCNFDSTAAQFHVLVNDFVVLKVNGLKEGPLVREYLIWASSEKLVIRFVPIEKTSFAFVNAIEVVSAPKDLVADTSMYVSDGRVERFDGLLSKQALQVVHRVNVGGGKVTPFNDSLWRTWSTDDEFFGPGLGSERVYFGGRVKYRSGGASREVGPDNVYNTARLIRGGNGSVANVNMTWVFPAVGRFKYLVRLHYCDIATLSLGLMYFNVYVDGALAYEDLDLSKEADYMLASPFYADFVVDGGDSDSLSVSVGPSKGSVAYGVDGILNGIEIMKLNNSVGSLDGENCAEWVLSSWSSGHVSVLVPLVAAACVLLSLSMVTGRRIMKKEESLAWSKLPVDVSDVNAKDGNAHQSVKFFSWSSMNSEL
ncbi:LOW QUALITY PROTEIN: probable receptor-like protein kinase At5g24010, partial [Argentina anserina]|uniref:LOW QUALITY PROTEIN: probable receptor-like protein kinase At5g24010 n=1 Tax=Argentina anserina TaxID=57926 RepID=UPI00217659F7